MILGIALLALSHALGLAAITFQDPNKIADRNRRRKIINRDNEARNLAR